MGTKENKSAIILVSSDPVFDQRAQKVKTSLSQMGYSVQIWGVQRHELGEISNDIRWKFRWKSGPLFYFFLGLKIFRALNRQPPSLVWACDPDTLWAASWSKKLKSFFLVYDSHELFSEVPELQGKPLKKRIWATLEKRCVQRTHLRFAVSKPIAEILSLNTGKKFQVLMNMPQESSGFEDIEKKNVILYQGAINQGRRIPELIAAIEHLPDWEVWIAGKGDLEFGLKKWSEDLPFSDRVKWLGMLSKDQLNSLSNQVKVGYNGLDWKESKSYEWSLANKFFDYVQNGIPVITAPTETYQEMLQEFEVGWLEDRPLEQILEEISTQPQEYKKKVESCKFAKEIWTWENQWKKIQAWNL